MRPKIDVIIPSYNGKYLLEKHLSKVIKFTENLNKVIVIDNGSSDGTIDWLKVNFPEVVIIQNQSNLGFTKPINQGVARSESEYLVLLNNDVEPSSGYLKYTLKYFMDKKVFAVSFNEESSSWPLVSWREGKLQFTRGQDKRSARYSAWASGGSAIFRRSIWDKLGGLNEIYAPFYWEDIGIGYRAWKMGYKIIWDNHSLVYHQHESTANKINQNYIKLIRQRNELLFTWMNITDKNMLRSHIKFLIKHTLRHPRYLQVIIASVIRFPQNKQKNDFVLSDAEVLNRVNKVYEKN